MRLFTNCIVIAAIITLPSFGQNTAVMIKEFAAKNVSSGDVSAVTEIFQNAILGTKKFRIIERAGIADILKEQELQLSGATDTKYAVAIGKIVSVNYLFSGSVSKLGSDYYVAVKLINVETAEIEDAWDANAASIGAIGPAVKELAAKAGGVKQVAAVNALSTGAYVEKTIANREDITVIDLNDTKATDDDLAAKIKHPEKVRVLRLANSLVSDRFMKEMFAKMLNLEEVVLQFNTTITENGALAGFGQQTKIKSLTLRGCPMATDATIISICKQNRELTELTINGTPSGDLAFIRGISQLSNLTAFSKSYYGDIDMPFRLTDNAVEHLVRANKNISSLMLERHALTDKSIHLIAENLKSPKLIVLNGMSFSESSLVMLRSKFPQCTISTLSEYSFKGLACDDSYVRAQINELRSAEILRITGTAITDDGMILLANNSEKLISIIITDTTKITDRSLERGLSNLKRIKNIQFYNCPGVSDDGVKALVGGLSHLVVFTAVHTAVTQKGINHIKEKFPQCIIKY